MRKYCTIAVSIPTVYDGPVDVFEWTSADPFPILGDTVGVDTETELITDSCLYPKLVVLGVYDGRNHSCYIANHEDAPEFMRQLCSRDIEQRYFNLGFDEGVLSNEDPDKPLLQAIDAGRVVDMQIRAHLAQIATSGFVLHSTHTLAGCCSRFLHIHLDKGDGTESSARMSFHRGTPITDEQARYLPMDCITTWALGEKFKDAHLERAVEVAHTKGMCVLSHISSNGFLVDMDVFRHFQGMLSAEKARQRELLEIIGFPFSDVKAMSIEDAGAMFVEALREFTGAPEDLKLSMPGKQQLRLMLIYIWNHDKEPDEMEQMRNDLLALSFATRSPGKAELNLYQELLDKDTVAPFDESDKRMAMPMFVTYVLKELASQTGADDGYDATAAFAAAAERMDEHPEWFAKVAVQKIGPRKFFQDHVKNLVMEEFYGGKKAAETWLEQWRVSNPKKGAKDELTALMAESRLKLATTKKSGDIQLTLKDKWRLDDLGIKDGFLDAYTTYNHAQKYLSTYLNDDYVKSDGRVHPRYVSVLRTGRTSCTSPNV